MTKQTVAAALARARKKAAEPGSDRQYWQFHAEQLQLMLARMGLPRGRPRQALKKGWRMIQ